MWFGVLGPLEVHDPHGDTVRIAGPARRQLLAALLCRAGRTVPAHVLIEDLWGGSPPRTAAKTLQSHIVRLREDLAHVAPSLLLTDPAGYRLAVGTQELDAAVFECALEDALHADEAVDAETSIRLLDHALARWRGEPYQDFVDGAFAIAERVRLTELRSHARELRTDLALGLGRTSELVPELEARVAAEPYRERGWHQLAVALYRAGRQSDALAALRRVSRLLADELGVDPSPDLRQLEARILSHDSALAVPDRARQRITPAFDGTTTCPYRGLDGYGERDAAVFVGRERLTAAIAAGFGERAVVLLTGASGSGKSSLVRAGVLPTLRSGALPGSASWRVEERTPSAWREVSDATDLLVLDQAEELFSVVSENERGTVVASIADHVGSGGRLLIVVRGDFFHRLAEAPPLDRWAEHSTILVGPMRDDEIRRTIVEPATSSGLVVDDALTEAVLDEIRGQPEALPMLSAAMVATWNNRDGNRLGLDGYRAGGGVAGAIEASADRVYQSLDRGLQDQARQLLVRLAQRDGGSWVRRPMSLAEASTYADAGVLRALVDGRLVSAGTTRVQLTHESLLDRWPKLRDWLDDRAVAAELLDHVRGAAQAWQSEGRRAGDLYRGVRLQAAREWQAQHPIELTPLEDEFLTASEDATDRELTEVTARAEREATGRRRLRRAAWALAALLVLALTGAAIAVVEGNAARDERRAADRSALDADSRKLAAQSLSAPDLRTSLLLSTAAYRLQDSADSRSALLAGLERSGVALWRLPTDNRVQWLGVSADGGRLWIADNKQTVTRFDATTHRQVSTFPLRASSVAAMSPDARLIVAVGPSGFDDTAGATRGIVLDAETGAVLDVLSVPVVSGGSAERTAAFTGDGRWLIVAVGSPPTQGAGTDKVAVFDAKHLDVPPRVMTLPDPVVALAAGTSTFAVRTDAGELDLVDPTSMSVLDSGHQASLASPNPAVGVGRTPIALSPDGTRLAVLSERRLSLPLLLDTDALGATPHPAADLGNDVNVMAFSPGSDLLAAGGSTGFIEVVHASDGTEALRLTGNSGQVMSLDWSSAGDGALFAAGLDSQIVAYDTSLTSRMVTPSGPMPLRANDMAPFGDVLIGLRPAEGDGPESKVAMIVEDARNGETLRTVPLALNDDDYVIGFTPDAAHRTVLVAIQHDDNTYGCRLFDLTSGRRIADFTPTPKLSPHQTFSATLSPDGTTVVASIADRTLAVIDVATGRTLRTITVRFQGSGAARTLATPVAFGPDGRVLVLGLDPGAPPLPPPGSPVAPSPGGDTSSEDSRAVMVDLHTAGTSAEIRLGSFGYSYAWDWSPDHRSLAIGTASGRLVVVDAATMAQVGQYVSAAAGFVVSVEYSPDGRTIATTGTDGVLNLWDAVTLKRIGLPIDAHILKTWWTPSGDL
ncbi:MAG: hypothetical protein QOJ34_139, partial [Pseudonocardiales bacterium]|nr:hypothetical protein [Pseudonocardiales bacterium]